jgi:hypothetical protein
MDAQEYDRIADLLMQIRKKYQTIKSENSTLDKNAVKLVTALLQINHDLADFDSKGWL